MDKDLKDLKILERWFWALWALFPLVLSMVVYHIWTEPFLIIKGVPSKAPVEFSFSGQLLVFIHFSISVVLYVTIIAMLHRLVRQFSRGKTLVTGTLTAMRRIAWLVMIFVLIEFPMLNLSCYFLYRLGDIASWEVHYYIEILGLAISLVLFALSTLIKKAIDLQEDVDLTV